MTLLQPLRLEVAGLDASPLPLDIALVKDHLAVDGDDQDTLIEAYIPAAVAWAESSMRRTIYARSHTWVLREFPCDPYSEIRLPRGKTQSIDSVAYSNGGSVTTLRGPSSGSPAGTDYQEDLRGSDGGVIMPSRGQSWPSTDLDVPAPVVITFTAGYGADEIPADITHALLFAVSDLLDTRGSADLTVFGKNLTTREALISRYVLKRWY